MTKPSFRRRAIMGLLAAWLTAFSAQAEEAVPDDPRFPLAPMHEEVLNLPGEAARPGTLEVTLFTPPGPGPFPLAVVNHGADSASSKNRGERRRFDILAFYFLSRGYAVALPMMRGFAGSSGTLPQVGCDLAALAMADGRDIRAVAETLGRRPGIDAGRMVVAGISFGGWNTMGFGVAPSPGARALVGFYPAVRSSACPAGDRSMVEGARRMAARTTLPSLWFYGDNDSVMPVSAWRPVFDAYGGARGKAELVAYGRYGTDAHRLFDSSDGMAVWTGRLDAFLAQVGLPSSVVFPRYLPMPPPPPTGFAGLENVAAVPFIGPEGRVNYQRFLSLPRPRAFAIGPGGASSFHNGGYDPLGRALHDCSKLLAPCQPYAVNDDVVWTGMSLRSVSRTVRMNTEASLGMLYSVKPDCSSNELPRVLVLEKPGHGAASAVQRDEVLVAGPDGPMAACNGRAVPTVAITYTPEAGYTGPDSLVLYQTDPGGRRQLIRVTLRVM